MGMGMARWAVRLGVMAIVAATGCTQTSRGKHDRAQLQPLQAREASNFREERVDCPLRCFQGNGVVGCMADCPPVGSARHDQEGAAPGGVPAPEPAQE